MESTNLLIGHKHGKEIYLIERFVASDYGRELSHVCGYMRVLGSSPRRSPPGGYSARVKGLDTQARALES
jgi:hypothetical protein